jgi:hypothetical protein
VHKMLNFKLKMCASLLGFLLALGWLFLSSWLFSLLECPTSVYNLFWLYGLITTRRFPWLSEETLDLWIETGLNLDFEAIVDGMTALYITRSGIL